MALQLLSESNRGGGSVVRKETETDVKVSKKSLIIKIKLPPQLQNHGKNLNNQVVPQQTNPTKPSRQEAVVKGGDRLNKLMKQDLEDQEKLQPKKRLGIKIKVPPLQNRGKGLNNHQVIRQQIKPTIAVEADSTLVKPTTTLVNPTSQETVVKGGDPPNKLMKQGLEDEEKFQLKLEATKRKLQQRYQQAKDSRKRIRLVELKDAPKQDLLDGSNKKPRNRYWC